MNKKVNLRDVISLEVDDASYECILHDNATNLFPIAYFVTQQQTHRFKGKTNGWWGITH